MRIKEIRIKGLFGMFDHVIPLNLDTHLSIIYGINGIGKSTVFKMLDCLFHNDSFNLKKIVFENLELVFENDTVFIISNKNDKLETVTTNKAEINNILKNLKVFLIDEKRLFIHAPAILNKNFIINDTSNVDEMGTMYKDAITFHSQKFSNLITSKRVEYIELTKSLESSLGKRILSKEIKTNLDKEALKKIVFEVQDRRLELQKIGLIESLEEENLTIPDDLDSGTQAVLSVSFQDIQTKLNIFDEIYEKLTLFLDILNQRRFSFKQISVNQQDGFLITNDNGIIIELTDLSTGEQHELILLYLLLFKAPENSLILIDEPETSLHIDWQAAFLKDMEDIIKLRKFDILISTHSPSIVSGRRELTIPLYGKKHE